MAIETSKIVEDRGWLIGQASPGPLGAGSSHQQNRRGAQTSNVTTGAGTEIGSQWIGGIRA